MWCNSRAQGSTVKPRRFHGHHRKHNTSNLIYDLRLSPTQSRGTGRGGGTVSSPTNLPIIVIYRPPCPLGNFIDELDTLLSLFPVDGSPLLLLGDFNLLIMPATTTIILRPHPQPIPSNALRSTRSSSPAPWLSDVLRNNRRELRRAERKWRRSQLDSDLHTYQAILSRFSAEVTTAKSSFYKKKLEELASDPHKLFYDVLQLLESSNPTTCPLDPIPSTLLWLISLDLLPFISSLINSSLSSGHVPQAFKTARVVPILKKPSLDCPDINSYRPNQLQDINQSGFKPAHSTETALITVTERLYTVSSAKLSSVLILLNLSAAFDTVNHKILLSVLTDLGTTGTAWKWFKSYLEDRHYQVCNRISACLTDISSWMTAHHLKLNPSRTELLFIPSTTGPHCDLAISFGNSLIAPTEDARSLGVILDGQFSFSAHIANLTRSCRFLLYSIRRILPFLSQ
ncbi:hypothetical protein NFI96_009102 [Prochilodus magdalenae]|nr:hypothetical protein NFI96_009102 [Prochilodus magdalenae]